ncbi:MAG: hypothetical protein MUF42_06425 [Cytophagaceae bacterium]|jgi:hypothetical protein|nr:hypothetical protein [Cytophagaceae bacterium]
MKKYFFICFFLVSVALEAQLSKSFGENSFVLNGDGFVNKKIILNIPGNDFKTNYFSRFTKYTYQDDSNHTVKTSGKSGLPALPIAGFEIVFDEFRGLGTYDLEDISMMLYLKLDNLEPYKQVYMQGVGSLTVTRADTVGKLMEGTFSGTFTRFSFNASTKLFEAKTTKVQVSEGKFSTVHYPDWQWDKPYSTGEEPASFIEEEEAKKKKKK